MGTRFSTLKKKKISLGPYEQVKMVLNFFFVFSKIFVENVCPRSCWLCWHNVSVVIDYVDTHCQWLCGHCVSVVVDYADIVSALSTTTLTQGKLFYFGKSKKLTKKGKNHNLLFLKKVCPCSCWLCWHCVSVVVDCTDTCWNSHWLCGHGVGVVVYHADTVLAYIVNDYADTVSE